MKYIVCLFVVATFATAYAQNYTYYNQDGTIAGRSETDHYGNTTIYGNDGTIQGRIEQNRQFDPRDLYTPPFVPQQ